MGDNFKYHLVHYIDVQGNMDASGCGGWAASSADIIPSLYLKHNIETTTGDGSKDTPYELLSE